MPTTERTPATEALLVERLKAATETLEFIAADRGTLALLSEDEQRRLRDAVAQVWNPDMRARRSLTKALARRRKRERSQRDDRVLAATGIRELRRQPVFTTPKIFAPKAFQAEPLETADPRNCYICKKGYSTVHHFYDRLCVPCGDLNFAKRAELADLCGRVALLTGGRVKIGYQAGLKLLRSGAHLIVTTRFPRDSAHGTRTNRILASGAIDWKSSDSISVMLRAWRLSAGACCRPAIDSTSSSTTPVRRSVVHPTFTLT